MPSTSAPIGFAPINHPSGTVRPESQFGVIESGYPTGILEGQCVKWGTGGYLVAAADNEDFIGVFQGCRYVPPGGLRPVYTNQWIAGSTYVAGTLEVWFTQDPTIVYLAQTNGSITQAAIGDQADIASATAGSTTTGLSAAMLSSTLVGVGVQGQWRILGLQYGPTTNGLNNWGDAYVWVRVQIARHQYVANKVAI
jgi:hypothetical protein